MKKAIKDLTKLGLSTIEANTYILLLQQDRQTQTSLRERLGCGQSKIARILNQLKTKNLINSTSDGTREYFEAKPIENLNDLLIKKKERLEKLKNDFSKTIKQLEKIACNDQNTSRVIHYVGLEGLKQVMWNSSKTKGTLRLLESSEMSEFLDYGFYEKIRKIYAKNNVDSREITNLTSMPEWTNIEEYVKRWQVKHLDPNLIKIKFETMIYDNIYTLYYIDKVNIFCVEIYNENLVKMQKQIFDYMWLHSKEMKVLDKHGRAELV